MDHPRSPASGILGPLEGNFRVLAAAIVPEAARLDDPGWRAVVREVEKALAARPAPVRRQFALFLRLLGWMSVARFGRRLEFLDTPRLGRLLASVESSRLLLLRRGFWGLRTLVFLGYWTRPESAVEIGYRARAEGWEARK